MLVLVTGFKIHKTNEEFFFSTSVHVQSVTKTIHSIWNLENVILFNTSAKVITIEGTFENSDGTKATLTIKAYIATEDGEVNLEGTDEVLSVSKGKGPNYLKIISCQKNSILNMFKIEGREG